GGECRSRLPTLPALPSPMLPPPLPLPPPICSVVSNELRARSRSVRDNSIGERPPPMRVERPCNIIATEFVSPIGFCEGGDDPDPAPDPAPDPDPAAAPTTPACVLACTLAAAAAAALVKWKAGPSICGELEADAFVRAITRATAPELTL